MIFKDEIQKIGEAVGLEGKFLVDWGVDNIIQAFNDKQDSERAIELLKVAAQYIRTHYPDGTIYYDESHCDGYCVADDCETAAEMLRL